MIRVLIDTDVILDALTDRVPFSRDAVKVLDLCEKKIIEGYTTPVVISNLYYLLRKLGVPHTEILIKIEILVSNILYDISTIDKKIILLALTSDFSDFEDALQNFSAVSHSNISLILTRNIKDYKKSNLAVMTPTDFLRSSNF